MMSGASLAWEGERAAGLEKGGSLTPATAVGKGGSQALGEVYREVVGLER